MKTLVLVALLFAIFASSLEESFDFNDVLVSDNPQPLDKQGNDVPEKPILETVDKISLDPALDEDMEVVSKGRDAYEAILKDSDLYGNCWLNAIEQLQSGCKKLNEEIQARLALSFTNCFLLKVGKDVYPCDASVDVRTCTTTMDQQAFLVFSQHFTHTQSICFFLANQLWQKKTKTIIAKLTDAAGDFTDRLETLQTMQKHSLEHQSTLNEEIVNSKKTLDEFAKTMSEQRSIESDVLARLLEVKQFVVAEFSKFYTVGYYLVTGFTIYLLTTTQRTYGARLGLILLLILNIAAEYMMTNLFVSSGSFYYENIHSATFHLNSWIWWLRKGFWLVGALYMSWIWCTYKDLNRINNELLQRIADDNREIKSLVSSGGHFRKLSLFTESSSEDGSYRCSESSEDEDYSSGHDTNSFKEDEVSSTTLEAKKSIGNSVDAVENTVSNQSFETGNRRVNPYNLRRRSNYAFPSPKESEENFIRAVRASELLSKQKRQLGLF